MEPERLIRCPICCRDLPESAFGICRARKSGRNLYDKECIRQKVQASRRALKEYKANRKRFIAKLAEEVDFTNYEASEESKSELSPVSRVRLEITKGARTLSELARETKLNKDAVSDAITVLLLVNHEIKTALRGDTRIYFIPEPEPEIEIARKPMVLGNWHTVQYVQPGRKRA